MAYDLKTRLPASSLGAPSRPPPATTLHAPSIAWRRLAWLALCGLGLVDAALLWSNRPRERPVPRPPMLAPPQCMEAPRRETFEAPAAAPLPPPTFLADGSKVELHDPLSRLFSEEDSSERVRLRLSGGATFDVVPNEARSFVVSNGQVVVRAMGTSFSVAPEDARTRVLVANGRAQVLWPRGAAVLTAGETALFPPLDEPAFVSRPTSRASSQRALRVKHAKHTKQASKPSKARPKRVKLLARR